MTVETIASPSAARVPTVGFVSLGCPKALTDSELILTQLSAEGYQTSKTFAGADLVIVNTCGFIDDAVKESLDTIGEALADNGRVIVTGCLGARADGDFESGNIRIGAMDRNATSAKRARAAAWAGAAPGEANAAEAFQSFAAIFSRIGF